MGDGVLDRRVQRTLARLRTAIVELVGDKGYQAVTVDHLCERAEVTRATFYSHFRDKEHLLSSVADDLVDRCLAVFADRRGGTADHGGERLVVLFEMAREPEALAALRIVLRGEGDAAALRRFRQRLRPIVDETLRNHLAELHTAPVVPLPILTELTVGEIEATLSWWVEQDEPEVDATTVVHWLRATTLHGRLWALGIDDTALHHERAAAFRAGLPPKETP